LILKWKTIRIFFLISKFFFNTKSNLKKKNTPLTWKLLSIMLVSRLTSIIVMVQLLLTFMSYREWIGRCSYATLSKKGMLVQIFLVKMSLVNDDKFKIWDSLAKDLNSFILSYSLYQESEKWMKIMIFSLIKVNVQWVFIKNSYNTVRYSRHYIAVNHSKLNCLRCK